MVVGKYAQYEVINTAMARRRRAPPRRPTAATGAGSGPARWGSVALSLRTTAPHVMAGSLRYPVTRFLKRQRDRTRRPGGGPPRDRALALRAQGRRAAAPGQYDTTRPLAPPYSLHYVLLKVESYNVVPPPQAGSVCIVHEDMVHRATPRSSEGYIRLSL